MSDLVERLLKGPLAYVKVGGDLVYKGPDALHSEAADAIDDLTAEVTALRAKVAQYEQAPVVGWASPNQVQELKDGYDGFMVPISMDQFAIPLIVRPEVTK